jgi:heme-degrading monooxygenase HmoA
MYRVIYHFHLKPDGELAFEEIVREWTHAMKHHPGFIAISLLREADDESKFVALSDWVSAGRYAAFFDSADHQRVTHASATQFVVDMRHAYNLVYQATTRAEA